VDDADAEYEHFLERPAHVLQGCREWNPTLRAEATTTMIRKLSSGKYRLYSKKIDPKTGKRKNLGTFDTREAATEHERAVQYFKHQH
jgi:hypothetical protein